MGGPLSKSGILVVTLQANGTLGSGKLVPVQLVGGVPRRISGGDIVHRVNALSHQDFGGSAVLVGSTGALGLG